MAVTIKKKEMTLESLAKRILDDEGMVKLAKAIEASGFKLVTEANVIKLENGQALLAHSPVKLSAIQKCLKGDLSYTGQKVLKEHIEAFIKKAYNLIPEVTEQVNLSEIYDGTMAKYFANGGGNKVAAIKFYREATGASLKEAKDKVEAWIDSLDKTAYDKAVAENKAAPVSDDEAEDAVHQMYGYAGAAPEVAAVTDAPVSLSAASKLMQPVTGTSGGSVYNVIALGAHAKVAVRIRKDNDVAIRVVPVTDVGVKACMNAGLDKKSGGHYSMHLHPDSKALVNKCVGSILFALDLDWDGVIGNMSDLVGVGK